MVIKLAVRTFPRQTPGDRRQKTRLRSPSYAVASRGQTRENRLFFRETVRGNPLTRNQRPETNPGVRISAGSYPKAFKTALRLLTRRDHSKYELAQKLKLRHFENDMIERVLLECARLDYLNDERTTRVLIGQLLRKGYGAKRIQHELNRKGLKGKRIAGILGEMLSGDVERESAERVLAKNIRRYERENDPQKRNDKIYRFLYARGFSSEVISELMKKC